MKTLGSNRESMCLKTETASDLSKSDGSSEFTLNQFREPKQLYTLRKLTSGSFPCKCMKGTWCYAEGGKRPCECGMFIPSHNA